MKKFKRIMALLLACALVCSIAACGKKQPSNQEEHGSTAQTETEKADTNQKETEATRVPIELIERTESTYEQQLAGAALIGISMMYGEFEIDTIYLASESDYEDKMESDGVYINFTVAGTPMAIHCEPLEGERTEAGTMDLREEYLGFATFEVVTMDDVDTDDMRTVTMDEVSAQIKEALLVSIYEH